MGSITYLLNEYSVLSRDRNDFQFLYGFAMSNEGKFAKSNGFDSFELQTILDGSAQSTRDTHHPQFST